MDFESDSKELLSPVVSSPEGSHDHDTDQNDEDKLMEILELSDLPPPSPPHLVISQQLHAVSGKESPSVVTKQKRERKSAKPSLSECTSQRTS